LGLRARVGDLGPKCSPLAGTWQIAFLGKAEPRAARPGRKPRRVMRVGPRYPWAVNKGPASHWARFMPAKCGVARVHQIAPVDSAESRRGIWEPSCATGIPQCVLLRDFDGALPLSGLRLSAVRDYTGTLPQCKAIARPPLAGGFVGFHRHRQIINISDTLNHVAARVPAVDAVSEIRLGGCHKGVSARKRGALVFTRIFGI